MSHRKRAPRSADHAPPGSRMDSLPSPRDNYEPPIVQVDGEDDEVRETNILVIVFMIVWFIFVSCALVVVVFIISRIAARLPILQVDNLWIRVFRILPFSDLSSFLITIAVLLLGFAAGVSTDSHGQIHTFSVQEGQRGNRNDSIATSSVAYETAKPASFSFWTEAKKSIKQYVKFAVAPRPSSTSRRIFWTCKCGSPMYDDYIEIRPGALADLEERLNKQESVSSTHSEGPARNTVPEARSAPDATQSSDPPSSQAGSQDDSSNTASSYVPDGAVSTARFHETKPLSEDERRRFLLLCTPYKKRGMKLCHINLSDIGDDISFFKLLQERYHSQRGRYRDWFSLSAPVSIRFIKFRVDRNEFADVSKFDQIPPENMCENGGEYTYNPLPAELMPPIGANYLMHFYENPDHASQLPDCFGVIPKKLRSELKACPSAGFSLGYGLCFVEGLSRKKMLICGCICSAISLLIGSIWSYARGNVSMGMTIATYILTILFPLVALLQTSADG